MTDAREIDEHMSLEEVAALVCTTLARHGILVVLSGGAVVSIYSDAEYVSYDLDFVPIGLARKVDGAMQSLGARSKSAIGDTLERPTGWSFPPDRSPSAKRRSTSSMNARARRACSASFGRRSA